MKMESNEGWIVCRVCLNNQGDSEDLLQDIFSQNANTRLDQMLHICAGIPVSADDNFPDKMCSKCARCLRLAYKFRQTCQRSHQHISDMLARGGNNTRGGGEESASSGEDFTAENIVKIWEEHTDQLDMSNVKLEDEEEPQEETVNFIVTPHEDDTGGDGDGEGLDAIVYDATGEDETETTVVYEDTQTVIEDAEMYTEYEEYELLTNESTPQHSTDEPAGNHSRIEYPVEAPDDDLAVDILSSDEASDEKPKTMIRSRPPRVKRTGKLGIIALDGAHFEKKLGRKPRDKLSTYICDVCGNTYPTQARLTEHMKFHSGIKPHECEICGRGFVQNQQLVRHMNTHTGNRPYKCNYCPAAFADRSTKTKHHRIHTKERPYECDVCSRTFTYSDNLKFHKMIHTGEKPHVCDLCGKGFVKAYKMRLHRVTHEKRGGPWKSLDASIADDAHGIKDEIPEFLS
ncbi:zinc finger protein OZF [Drosophila obscura]|uniref:zinc finger protein OZF n=1 Tax=Drosophila obscura TaxID=7282 RepID=UPI001BB28B96|nr:zinc finger protein OZF [Drosophila obscura]